MSGDEHRARPRHPREPLRAARAPAAQRGRPRRRDAGRAPARGQASLERRWSSTQSSEAARVEIVVADDGRGVSNEILAEAKQDGSLADVLARAGFSTAVEVTELSGRGVGLDAVKLHVESFGGTLEAFSEPGEGTRITLVLPLTLALLDVLLVERGGQVFGLPLASVR